MQVEAGSRPTAMLAIAGALSLAVLMIICWIGALVADQQSHAYILIFTTAAVDSTTALTQRLVWSAVFDADRGQAVGAHIKMGGSAFGVSLYVDEVVTVASRRAARPGDRRRPAPAGGRRP